MDENKEYDINDNIGRMRAAHFKVLRERLALPMQYVADRCGATRITVARWESGATRIPPAAATMIRALDDYTRRCVDAVADAARERRAPMVVVWERAEEMPPGPARELGPRWWRGVVARAVERVPSLIVGYPRELDRLTGSRERVTREAIGTAVTPTH